MFNFKALLNDRIFKGFDELSQELSEKYYNKEVFVHFGIDQNRMLINREKIIVKEFNIIENDGRFEKMVKFNDLVYVVVLTDINNNEIWINSLDFLEENPLPEENS
jgi:hypothetical protein